jgi:hypothetical protein
MVMPARGDETTISGSDAEPTEDVRSTVVAAPAAASPELSDLRNPVDCDHRFRLIATT